MTSSYHKPKGSWVFSDAIPLLPPSLKADPWNPDDLANLPLPWQHRRQCWLMSPPICPECGLRFPRPYPDEIKRSKNPHRIFCSQTCATRWERRMYFIYFPESLATAYWPGRNDNPPEVHPDVLAIKQVWNEQGDRANPNETRGTKAVDICGAKLNTYPTNDYPLRPDRRGTLCRQPAGIRTSHPGIGPCWKHASHNSWKKANRILATERMREREFILGTPHEVTPEQAILDEVHRTAGHVSWLFEKIQRIGDEDTEDKALAQFTKLGITPSVWMDMYQKERQHLMNVAKTAASMGIAQRQIEIAEEQGRMLATVLQRFLESPVINLTPEQRVNAPEVIRELLSTVTADQHAPRAELTEHTGVVDAEVVEEPQQETLFDVE